MKILVAIALMVILASLVLALVYMMRPPREMDSAAAPKRRMATALALRVGLSIVLFVCVLISWKMGWIQPTGIPPGA